MADAGDLDDDRGLLPRAVGADFGGVGVRGPAMTREQVKEQVMGRVKIAEQMEGVAHLALNRWVEMFPQKYIFSYREVMAGCSLVRRELGLK